MPVPRFPRAAAAGRILSPRHRACVAGAMALVLAGRAASLLSQESVVINEIHYDPADVTSAEEFVELHNPGDAAVDVSSWALSGAVSFLIPPGTTIPAGGYLVIAEDPARLQDVYFVSALGPYAGGLSKNGETVRIRNSAGIAVDEVSYGAGFPWPTASQGAGSSMELVNPGIDNDLGGSWRASGFVAVPPEPLTLVPEADEQWHYRPGNSEASDPVGAWRGIGFVEDGTWIAGAKTPIGYGDGDDNTVISGMQGVYSSMFLRRTFTIEAEAIPAQLLVRMYVDDGAIVWLNGVEVARFNMGAGDMPHDAVAASRVEASWEEAVINNAGGILQPGLNVLAVQAFNDTVGSSDFSIDTNLRTPDESQLSNAPTPGGPNSVTSPLTRIPPAIRQVAHLPEQPPSGSLVTVTAKVTDADGVEAVTLHYQTVEPGQYIRRDDAAYEEGWLDLPMRDDGLGGDLVAGDGTFTVLVPESVQVHRRLVRYRITVRDVAGNSALVPYEDDDQPNFAYFVYDGAPAWSGADRPGTTPVVEFPEELVNSLPTYHLVANQTDVINSQYNSSFDGRRMWGTLIYDGEVHDHIQFANRGEFSTYVSGKNKWRFYFNRARDLQARDNYGKKYASTWDEMTMNACASPWAAVNRGMAGLDEAVSFRLQQLAGVPSSNTHYLHFRVIDNAAEASASNQYEGDLWGLYMAVETPDGSFLNERGLADGNVYKIESNNGDLKHQSATQPTNGADWNAFRNASGGNQTVAWWRENMDLPAYYSFRACNRITGNVDLREGWNHYFYHHPDGRWFPVPWDLDMMFVAETHWSGTIVQKSCLNQAEIRTEFRNRCRELMDLMLEDPTPDGGQIGQLVDEFADIVNPPGQELTWSDLDRHMWNWHPRTQGSGTPSGQTNHKGNFHRTPFSDQRQGGSWTRTLESSDHEGFVKFLVDYMTDTDPNNWSPGDGDQRGYGFNYLESEAADSAIPDRPTVTYTGPAGFPVNGLTFRSSSFADPQGAGSFGAMQWRIAEIRNPSTPAYEPGTPRKYEVEPDWESEVLTAFAADVEIPAAEVRPDGLYRVRVRHQDNTGRWSHWSEAVEFTTTTPDISELAQNLMISEVNYHPYAPTGDELAVTVDDDDFEFIELHNVGDAVLDLTDVRFTKGIDFDIPAGTLIGPGAYLLVVRRIDAFQARYGTGLPVIGEYIGNAEDKLGNGGDQVRLSFGKGIVIREFEYLDGPPWPAGADGGGATLTLADPESRPDHALPESWRASYYRGGSPGGSDSSGGYATWKQAVFTAADLADPAISGDDADPDGDSLSNTLEYAQGGDPKSPDAERLPSVSVVEASGNQHLAFTYRALVGAGDVAYAVEESTDARTWTDAGGATTEVSRVDNGDGTESVTVRLLAPIDGASPNVLLRLRVTIGL